MKQANSKSLILSQDIRESSPAVNFKHQAYAIAEKALNFFVSKEMHKLKSSITDQLIAAFQPDVKRVDAVDCSKTILECLTKTILEASPKYNSHESIFEEEPDLVAFLVQKSLKNFFRDFRDIVLTLTDKVRDFNSKFMSQEQQQALQLQQQQQQMYAGGATDRES